MPEVDAVRAARALDWAVMNGEDYGLTAQQVRAAYAKWLRVDDLAQVTQGPAPH